MKLHKANTLAEVGVLSQNSYKSMNSSQGSSGSKKRRPMVKIDISTVKKGATIPPRMSGELQNFLKDSTNG